MAHDFNNLLTVIMGYSADLSSNPILDIQVKKDAAEIFKAGSRAKELTKKLLTFSRKQVVQAKVVDITELINNLQGVFDRLLGSHIRISCFSSPESAIVKADPGQIEQVVINLVLNSRDAMPGGGLVTIKTSVLEHTTADIESLYQVKPGKYVMLSVSDNGHGIPMNIQSKLFEPFFSTKGNCKGLGLGLTNVLSIIRSSGGGIGIKSAPGQGTEVNLLLPFCFEMPAEEDIGAGDVDHKGMGETILFVDDEEALSAFFHKTLSKLGYAVTVANSGAEALLILEKGLQPALVITDIVMPGMNGKDLAERIKKQSPEQKVLFISGFTDDLILPLGVLDTGIPLL
ncbi:MAG: ATP-binding protein, partial [Candidatus Cloacimonadaceae bacterium]|nr:ATP-binding protein [Candidatus Cloacimonadaceae bacterium]